MSYILEALKKAQAERQLGSTPGIHDVAGAAAVARTDPGRARLWLAAGAAAVVLAAGGYALMRSSTPQAEPAAAATPAGAPVTAAVSPAAVPPLPAAAPATVSPPPPVPQPAAEVAQARPAPEPAPQPPAAPQPTPTPQPQPQSQSQSGDAVPLLASLPPSVAAGIPRVTLGGYIYSPVPSERLLLVDKDLRREGEEVAPGLVLEKLTPDGAVMNYRGTRFRMPY